MTKSLTNPSDPFFIANVFKNYSLSLSLSLCPCHGRDLFCFRRRILYHGEKLPKLLTKISIGSRRSSFSPSTEESDEFFKCSIWGEVYGTGLTEIEIGGEQRSGIKVDEVRKSSNSVHDKGFNFDDARLMRGAWWSEPNPDMCKMTKLAIIPCTVLLETIFFRKKFSRNIQLSLTILLLGVGIATVTDLQLNVLGSAITLFITGPFVDGLLTNLNVFAFKYTPQVLAFIVLSCLISVSVNFSTFLVIGKTSPVTYQVLGHLKTCLVLAFGYGLLHDPFSWRNILGILFALVGMILYSYCCTLESQQKASEASVQLSQAKESESEPLMSVENGASVLADSVVSKSPAWSSNKDLRA